MSLTGAKCHEHYKVTHLDATLGPNDALHRKKKRHIPVTLSKHYYSKQSLKYTSNNNRHVLYCGRLTTLCLFPEY